MSQNHPIASRECATFAPLLPLAAHNLLSQADEARLGAHLAGCAQCQAALNVYDQVAMALRRGFEPDQAARPPFSREELMHLLDYHPNPILEQPAPTAPPIVPARPPRRARRVLAGFPALAAVLAIVLVAVILFNAMPRKIPGISSIHATPARGSNTDLHSISMISPEEGWAVGNTLTQESTGSGTIPLDAGNPVILHYLHGRWTPQPLPDYTRRLGCGGSNGACPPFALYDISMASAQEGWAIGSSVLGPNADGIAFPLLLHYAGGKWVEVDLQNETLGSIYMRSANDGWAIGLVSKPNNNGSDEVLHYDGQNWTPVFNPGTLSVAPASIFGTAGGDLWITGIDSSVQVGDGEDGNEHTALLHYDGTRWSKVDPHIANGRIYSFAFTSPNEGWAVGMQPNSDQHRPSEVDGLILHYQNGIWEQQALLKDPFGQSFFSLSSVAMVSPTEGWAVGQDGVMVHYLNGVWKQVQSPTSEDLSAVTFISANEGWAVGNNGIILHYHNSAWNKFQD